MYPSSFPSILVMIFFLCLQGFHLGPEIADPHKAELPHTISTCVYCVQFAFSKKLRWFELTKSIFLENATACSKRTLKTRVATSLKL